MSDYIALGVITARHADLLREADEARLARICRSQQRQRHRPGRIVSWLWHGQPRPSAGPAAKANARHGKTPDLVT
jgi:hypothetical protein